MQAADNVYIATFISFIWEHVRTSIAKANLHLDHATLMPINMKEHTAIYDAIKDRDVDRARECMRVHIANAMSRLGFRERDRGQEFVEPRRAFAPNMNAIAD